VVGVSPVSPPSTADILLSVVLAPDPSVDGVPLEVELSSVEGSVPLVDSAPFDEPVLRVLSLPASSTG
jgi:hypothetical protein